MPDVGEIVSRLESIAPLAAAEAWDNVGLLVGDRRRAVTRLMTCLTLTPTTAAEAIRGAAELVVVHHPLPFRPVSRITTDTTTGRLLWELIGAGVCVYCAHTAFDSARDGINEQWAARLKLQNVTSLNPGPSVAEGDLGSGRWGTISPTVTILALAQRIKELLSLASVRVVGSDETPIARVGVACGSGGSFLEAARRNGCDCLVTGEATFHGCLEAEAMGMSLVLCGHYASERFAMEQMADRLALSFPGVTVWASVQECDPLREA